MAVPVVEIGIVHVGVDQRCMAVGVAMRAIHRFGVRVVVMLVVTVDMVVLDFVVGVLVHMPLGEVQP